MVTSRIASPGDSERPHGIAAIADFLPGDAGCAEACYRGGVKREIGLVAMPHLADRPGRARREHDGRKVEGLERRRSRRLAAKHVWITGWIAAEPASPAGEHGECVAGGVGLLPQPGLHLRIVEVFQIPMRVAHGRAEVIADDRIRLRGGGRLGFRWSGGDAGEQQHGERQVAGQRHISTVPDIRIDGDISL